jgi:hypothetical protein
VTKTVFTQWLPLQRTAHMGGMHVLQTALVLLNADLRAYLWYRLVFVGQILVCYAEIAFGI